MAPEKKRGDKNDVTWEHCKHFENDKKRLQCNHCNKTFWGGVFRMKHHIAGTRKNVAPCSQASEEVTEMFRKLLKSQKTDKKKGDGRRSDIARPDSYRHDRETSTDQGDKGKRKASMDDCAPMSKKKQCTLNKSWENGERDTVCQAIARFFYANSIPLNVVESPYFASMMEGVSHFGKGLKLPSCHELENKFMEKEVTNINALMDIQKKEWEKRGCTIMSDSLTNGAHRSITNFFVGNVNGTYFLKSVDISSFSNSSEDLFELFDSVVEQVGEERVVQFVTDSASDTNVKAGELLMQKRKKLSWSPSATHLLDLMLADIVKWDVHAETIAKGRIISLYIYQHHWVHDLMRKYTENRELLNPASTRFATIYLNLNIIHEQKAELTSMFTSKEWESSSYSKEEDARKVRNILLSDAPFWDNIHYCIKCVAPFLKVLRLLGSNENPYMSHVYEMMVRAKDAILDSIANDEMGHDEMEESIRKQWDVQQKHYPLYGATCYLNPAFHYEEQSNTERLKIVLDYLLERLCPSLEERLVIETQLEMFKTAVGSFGSEMATITRKTMRPDLWWESYGGSCPELQRLAMRVLIQSCSALGCERNWSTFDMIHSVKRNRIEQCRLNALVYVKYNLNLRERQDVKYNLMLRELQKMRETKRGLDAICLLDIESDDEWFTDEWITEKKGPTLPEDPSWLKMLECFEWDRPIEYLVTQCSE